MRVATFGAFDLLHYGHMRLLARIAADADHLVVGLASDALIGANGKSAPVYSYEIRREMLLHTRHVDEVVCHDAVPDGTGRVKLVQAKIDLVRTHAINAVVMGDDWQGHYDFLLPFCAVRYLPRTNGISTTLIRSAIAAGR
ncbi:adenylyltransferase/cytidyltransferase family protein [Devosia enhydra]|uniref:adenylyltransferase/cytidyltransferase family protein n=1 Tax=Devosia enhydra TaxID=665118 RepID=UPI001AECD594|nr:adenylyltransferase/cytidyltransferase family protein [Devosia enhydra]